MSWNDAKLFIVVKQCEDKEEYCTLNPDCELEIVKKNCPQFCNLCEEFEFARRNQEGETFMRLIVYQKDMKIPKYNWSIEFIVYL